MVVIKLSRAIFILAVLCMFTCCSVNTDKGKGFTGIIRYSLSIIPDDTSAKAKEIAKRLKGSIMDYYCNGSKERWEVDYPCCLPPDLCFAEAGKRDLIIYEYNSKGTKSQMSQGDLRDFYQSKIRLLDTTKIILGYKCREAELSGLGPKGVEIITDVFYTNQLPASIRREYKQLNGFPLAMTIRSMDETAVIVAQSLENKALPDSLFIAPEVY